jgi:DNA-binding CsgD family transcriptional regulator
LGGRFGGSRVRAWLEPSSDLGPHVEPLLRNGALLRWCVVALIVVRLVAEPPRLAALAVPWLLGIASWNTAVLWLRERLAPVRAARIAQAAVLADLGALMALVLILDGSPGALSAAVTLVLLEAVICWGVPGVLITSSVALAALTAVAGARCALLHASVNWSDVGSEDGMIGLVSMALVMARRLHAHPLAAPPPVEMPPPSAGVRMTSREREVLVLLAQGCSNTAIANRLHVTESTVKRHVESILIRLDVHNRAAAVAVAHRMGLLD